MSEYADPSPVGWDLRSALDQVRTGTGRATVDEVLHSRGLKRWAFGAGIWLVYLLGEVPTIAAQPFGTAVTNTIVLVAFCAVYLFAVPFAFAGFRIVALCAPLVMTVLLLAYLPVTGADGLGLAVYVGVVFVVCWPRPYDLIALGLLALAVALLPQLVSSWNVTGIDWGPAVPLVLGSLVAWAFVGLQMRNYELREARSDVARLAAEQERTRIARDMHDILGHTLTTVTVKASLAQRLVDRDPERAAAEMKEVESLARQGLADVRAVIGGYREVSVGSELAAAREVLRAAGIDADLPGSTDEVTPELTELFGWAVREGVTNVVRHSHARSCRIVLEPRAVEVADDGVAAIGDPAGRQPVEAAGHGLAGLRERVAAAGGRLEAGPTSRGFRLRVEVPA